MDLGTVLTGSSEGLVDLALLVGRVAIGICFVVHALGKLGLVGTGNLAAQRIALGLFPKRLSKTASSGRLM